MVLFECNDNPMDSKSALTYSFQLFSLTPVPLNVHFAGSACCLNSTKLDSFAGPAASCPALRSETSATKELAIHSKGNASEFGADFDWITAGSGSIGSSRSK